MFWTIVDSWVITEINYVQDCVVAIWEGPLDGDGQDWYILCTICTNAGHGKWT